MHVPGNPDRDACIGTKIVDLIRAILFLSKQETRKLTNRAQGHYNHSVSPFAHPICVPHIPSGT